MDRDNSKRASSNTQSACRISHTSVTAVLLVAHICEQYVWLASARLSAPVSRLFFPGSEPGRSVAARLMSAAVLCVEARQSQPRGSVPGCKLTCSLPIPTCQIHTAQRTLQEFSNCTILMGRGLHGGLPLQSQLLPDQGILPSCLPPSHSKS